MVSVLTVATGSALYVGLKLRDLVQMGIRKRAHQKKLVKAVERLTLLMEQGRTPEGPLSKFSHPK